MSTITPPQTRIGFDSAGILMTIEEFDAITDYDELYCYELIHGVLVVNPIPSEAESDPNEELGHLLRVYRDRNPSLLVLTLPERYVLLPGSRRRADRVIWAGLGRRPNPKVDPPTIVVEFVSVGKRDRHRDYVEKRGEYIAAGIQEYWIIDRFQRQMTVCKPDASDQIIKENEIFRTELLPGFELPLAKLLSVADVWKDQQ